MFGNKTFLAACGIAVLAAAGLVFAHPGFEGPSPEKRKEFLEKRIAQLPTEEQELARQIVPLRDSLMRAIGDYRHKVHEGAKARTLTTERATIQSLQSRVWTLESRNPDVTLDLLADMPGPFEGRGGHRPPPGDSAGACPRHGHWNHPPPPEED
jgi:hypothetical protein